MAYTVGQNVVDFGDNNLRYGWVVAIVGNKMDVQFNDNGDVCVYDVDDEEYIMSVDDWNRAGRELRADQRAERLYFGMDA